jgi:GDP-L-fucose synthase
VKILVAGSSGLVGSAIMRKLSTSKHEVLGISSKNLNLLDREITFNYLSKISPDIVIDAAAKVGGIGANNSHPVEFLSENLRIQTNLIDASHSANVEKFVFLGSSCIYPKLAHQPIKESALLSDYLEPTNSAYALAKIAGIELIKSYRSQYGRNWISLMPANLYGPGDNFNIDAGHVLPSLINKFHSAKVSKGAEVELWGDGTPFREFLYVEDLAEAVIYCAHNYNESEHMNIGSGHEISISELANLIANIVGFEGSIRWDKSKPNGTPRKLLDSTKIFKLGWQPSIKLEQGIQETYEWFQSQKIIRN